MRRGVSIVLFVLGGWMLMTELLTAFIDVEPGLADNAGVIGLFGVLAGAPLLLGAWASPGERWRELGLTMLIASGIGLFCGLSVVVVLNDPGFKPFRPPLPDITLSPWLGGVNLLVFVAVAWLLYRRGGAPAAAEVNGTVAGK